MADALEAVDDFSDEREADRSIDRASFARQQFDIFKHNFRELAAEQQEALLQTGFEQGFLQVHCSARRLARARGALLALDKEDQVGAALLVDITALLKQLDGFTSDAKTRQAEFSPSTARLPPYDADEMQLFLGADVLPTATDPAASFLSDIHTPGLCKQRIDELLLSVDVLLNRFTALLHALGLCDAFLYK